MAIPDHNLALKTLQNISYFRFKIYLTPFYDVTAGRYEPGASFSSGVDVYRFDEELRGFLFSVISRIEIKLRTKIDQVVTNYTGDPFWYLDDSLFTKDLNFVRAGLASQFQQSKIPFAVHFKSNYYNSTNPDFKQLPPFWTVSELMTFGNIKSIYSSLDKTKFGTAPNNKLDGLAKEFGAKNLKTINNWINLIRDVRNVCAHHNRAWNSNYREPAEITGLFSPAHPPSHSNRIYHFIGLLHVISRNLGLDIQVKNTILGLANKYPSVTAKLNSAGFPANWDSDPFWN